MGGGSWDPRTYRSYVTSKSYDTKSTDEIFDKKIIDKSLDPKGVKIRESRDSKDKPNTNAIIIGLDVTGSMSCVLDAMARKGLDTLCTEIYNRKPVSDPHIMIMGIGDAEAGDQAPLQVTQFEADIRILQQLEKVWLEGHGGGNDFEGYTLPWYFAALHTSIDCFEKRKKKGYLFTVGDEEPTPILRAIDVERVLGYKPQSDLDTMALLSMVSKQYNVFHLMVEEGAHFRGHEDDVIRAWGKVLGQKAISLADHTKLAEVIVSIIQANEGTDIAKVASSWSGDTSVVVTKAIKDLKKSEKKGNKKVVKF